MVGSRKLNSSMVIVRIDEGSLGIPTDFSVAEISYGLSHSSQLGTILFHVDLGSALSHNVMRMS